MATSRLERPLLDEIYGLKNLALEASLENEKIRKIGPLKTRNVSARWRADPETQGDVISLGGSLRYLGGHAIKDRGQTWLYITDNETGLSDEYTIDFKTEKIGILTAVKGYSFKGRIAEIRASREEATVGFNAFDQDRQEMLMTELQRGASGLYTFEPPIDGTINIYE